MCIRDSMSIGQSKATEVKPEDVNVTFKDVGGADEAIEELQDICLLYTSDAADDLLCVDLGGCRIFKKKKK